MTDLGGFEVEECSPPTTLGRDSVFRCFIGRCEVVGEDDVEEMLDHPFVDRGEAKRFRVLRRRAEHVTGRHLLHRVLQRWVAGPLNGLRVARDDHRAPHLIGWPDGPPPFISISHTNGMAFAVVCTSPVGIDAEPRHAERHPRLKHEVMAQTEIEALGPSADEPEIINTVWTMKEAIQKSCGLGMKLVPSGIPLVDHLGIDLIGGVVQLQNPAVKAHVMSWVDDRSPEPLIVALALLEPNRI